MATVTGQILEKNQRLLEIHRVSFERIYNEILKNVRSSDTDFSDIQGDMHLLQQKVESITELHKIILDLLLDEECSEENIDATVAINDDLISRFNKLKYKIEQQVQRNTFGENCSRASHSGLSNSRLRLPRIEFKKFGGHVKDWLRFWGQFKRIDEDETIALEDKFQYLVEATIPKSRARNLVEGYPPIGQNYPKALESLKSRFGREDLLVEFYVRELLKLVLTNLQNKTNVSSLFDDLESQLRALETLGVTSEKYAAMLFPLVESSLPEDILRVWKRSLPTDDDVTSEVISVQSRLKKLMNFLRKEVADEEKISMALSGFDLKTKRKDNKETFAPIPTTSGLVNHKLTQIKCHFCKNEHSPNECEKALKMDLSEKKKILSSKGCCHICLKFGHIARRCRVHLECSDCKKRHATVMCPNKETISEADTVPKNIVNISNVENLSNLTYNEVFLQTLVVDLCNGNYSKRARVIIDTGSQRSYINKFSADEMGFESIGEENLVHALFGGSETETVLHHCYRIQLANLNKNYACNLHVLDQPMICSNIVSIKGGPWLTELKELKINVSDRIDGPIEVLIGADVAGKIFTGKRHLLKCGLVAMETLLGWTLMGKAEIKHSSNSNSSLSAMSTTSLLSHCLDISNLWKLDILGISDPKDTSNKKEKENEIMNHFLDTVCINKEGRYEVSLPWIGDHPPLPTLLEMSKKRLDNLMVKLEKDGYYTEYNTVFSEWLKEGVIEYVPEEEIDNGRHYLPHRHVIKLSSTTKLRPVFDASAHEKNRPSLNQCLEKGINFIELIPATIFRFRMCKLGVIADIKRAFLQISIKPADRDFLRFLWYDENRSIKYFRHARVVFGLSCSPFHLGVVIQHHLTNILNKISSENSPYSEIFISKLLKGFYVDNCVVSLDSEEEVQEFIHQAREVMNEGKFDLRGWEYTRTGKDNLINEQILSNVLGLKWSRQDDTLGLCFDWFRGIHFSKITKRTILSITNKIFDPIGFCSPISLFTKILLQKLWVSKISWDSEVPQDILNVFLKWFHELNVLVNLKIPRWFFKDNKAKSKDWSLHMFADASKDAYAAVVFLKSDRQIQLVQAKSRVSPLKKISIPRLELLAANIGARLLCSILEILENTDVPIFCWSDSSTVLSWIKKKDQWKTFVWNRVQEIRSLSKIEDWHFVPGYLNPADLPSRGCFPHHLLKSKWWEGPSWLLEDKSKWPSQNFETNEDTILEEKKKTVVSTLNTKKDFSWYYNYFSKYRSIVRLVGWIKRFCYNCKNKDRMRTSQLSLDEIEDSERTIAKLIQEESFTGLNDKSLSSLQPVQDEFGLFRVKTKITERDDFYNFRYPIILPSSHTVVYKMIYQYHIDNCHLGIQGLISMIRERFWIIKTRKTIRAVISKCVTCRRNDAKNLETSPVALPNDRIRDVSVFQVSGVDLCGPLYIKKNEKVWVCIFTCAVYRAVHLEIVSSLSTESFLYGLRNFISRRGRPDIIYSDNGTNFVGADNAFKSIDWEKVVKYSNVKRICWKFNPPTACWWGGWWERLIRLLKQLLKKTLGKISLSFQELYTVLCECEALMNSRPLTYVTEDSQDLIPLTPAMFLQDIKEVEVGDLDEVDKASLNKHLRYKLKLREELGKRFRREYLSQLIIRPKRSKSSLIKIGDVVLLGNDTTKRIDWPLALVVGLVPGNDGNTRLVQLKTNSGIIFRPIQRLFPLEVSAKEAENLKVEMKGKFHRGKGKCTDFKKDEKLNQDEKCVVSRYGRQVKRPDRLQI